MASMDVNLITDSLAAGWGRERLLVMMSGALGTDLVSPPVLLDSSAARIQQPCPDSRAAARTPRRCLAHRPASFPLIDLTGTLKFRCSTPWRASDRRERASPHAAWKGPGNLNRQTEVR